MTGGIRVYFERRGAHVHCRVFTMGLCGTLTFDEQEWPTIADALSRIAQVIPERHAHA
jgi:hypothetical protein